MPMLAQSLRCLRRREAHGRRPSRAGPVAGSARLLAAGRAMWWSSSRWRAVLMLLMLASAELARFVILHQKMDRVATTVSDLVSRAETINETEMADIFEAIGEVASPFSLTDLGVVIVSSVTNPDGNGPIIAWQAAAAARTARRAISAPRAMTPSCRRVRGAPGRDRDHLRGVLRLHAVPQRADRGAAGGLSGTPITGRVWARSRDRGGLERPGSSGRQYRPPTTGRRCPARPSAAFGGGDRVLRRLDRDILARIISSRRSSTSRSGRW